MYVFGLGWVSYCGNVWS